MAGDEDGAGTAVVEATTDRGVGGCSSVGCDELSAVVITATTSVASATIPAAASIAEVHRRCGVKSGNSDSATAEDDHGWSASSALAAALMSWPVPRYNGRVVAVAGVSAVSGEVVEEMALPPRDRSRPILVNSTGLLTGPH